MRERIERGWLFYSGTAVKTAPRHKAATEATEAGAEAEQLYFRKGASLMSVRLCTFTHGGESRSKLNLK